MFGARSALVWPGGGRVWHGRVRARSAVQENPRASCGTLCEECKCRAEEGRGIGLSSSHEKVSRRRAVVALSFPHNVACRFFP